MAKKKIKAKKKKLTTSKVYCTICKECKGMSKARKEKLVGVFGSLEEVHTKYVCRTCRKANNVRKDGKKKPEKRKRKPKLVAKWRDPVTDEIVLPDYMKNICEDRGVRAARPEELKKVDVCYRPDLNVDKLKDAPKGFCPETCPYHLNDSCGASCKEFFVPKVKKKKLKKAAKAKKKKAKKSKKKAFALYD